LPTSIIAPMPERRLTGGLTNFSPVIGVFSLVGRTDPYSSPRAGSALVDRATAARSFHFLFRSPATGLLSSAVTIEKTRREGWLVNPVGTECRE
jgi:hypothetical protein